LKIKTDFVTNSSSSCFIVAWDKEVKTYEDVKKYIRSEVHAKIVYGDILKQQPMILQNNNFDFDMNPVLKSITNRISSEISSGWFDGYRDSLDAVYEYERRHNCGFTEARKKCKDKIDEVEEYNKNLAIDKAKKFIDQNVGKVVYMFSYADEDGALYSEMEHGDIFVQLPHITISHH